MPTVPHSLTPSLGYSVNSEAVTFDGELLTTANIILEFAQHTSMAERTINTLPIARRDGSVFIMQRYGEKMIQCRGILKGSSAGDLQSRIDTLSELLSREQKALAIFSGGVKRVYTATAKALIAPREHYHMLFVPFTVEFVVATGEGQDTATTAALSGQSLVTTTPATTSFVMSGSKPSRPTITIDGANWPSGCLGMELENTDTGEKVTITDPASWGTTSEIVIDCDAKIVTHAAILADFYGTLPLFKIGTNNLKITAGALVNQKTSEPALTDMTQEMFCLDDGTNFQYVAISFQVPYANATFQGIELPLVKDSGTVQNLTVRIETDSGGSPSGSLVTAGATWTIAPADVPTGSYAYVDKFAAAAFTLPANTTLWIVFKLAASDTGHLYYWKALTAASSYRYSGGTTKYKTQATGGLWVAETGKFCGFKILYGGKNGSSNVSLSVAYKKTYL